MAWISNKIILRTEQPIISKRIERYSEIILFILFALISLNTFSQADSIPQRKIKLRAGVGIFAIPGVYIEKNISRKLSVEAGIITCLVLSEGSIGLKSTLINKNKFKIKAGIGLGMSAYFWHEKSNPTKSGQDIYWLPVIPFEFIYKKISLELQPAYPVKITGDGEVKFPIIAFLSYIIHG